MATYVGPGGFNVEAVGSLPGGRHQCFGRPSGRENGGGNPPAELVV